MNLHDTTTEITPTTPVIDDIDAHLLHPLDAAALDTRDFYAALAAANTAHTAATKALQDAQDNLATMLTEQLTRHITTLYPAISLLFVRVAAEYHHTADGHRNPACEGHNHRLAPFEAVNEEGVVLGGFEPLDPAHYILERLTPLLGLEDQVLDIEAREWAYDCTAD